MTCENDAILKLENQVCFPLYVCAKEVVKRYKPFLDKIDLTYTQYITMMVMWEKKEINVKALGEYLFLDSGTLTPLLKKLEAKNLVKRERAKEDERNLIVTITDEGEQLKQRAMEIPEQVKSCVPLEDEDLVSLCKLLHKIMKCLY